MQHWLRAFLACASLALTSAACAADFTMHPDEPIGAPLVGFGAQFNPYLYCTPNFEPDGDVTAGNVADLERKLRDLRPQHVRIFFQPEWWDGGKDNISKNGSPFAGPVYDQKGKVLIPKGKVPTYAEIEATMTGFVKGVVGEIPKG